MRKKRVITTFILTMAFGAAAALPAGAQENSEVFHAKLTTNVYGDGQKPWYVSLEYDQTVDPESVSVEDFTVEGYEIVAVYTNTEETIPETSVAGNYVLLELSTDYTTTGYGGTGAGESGGTVMERPGNGEDRPETMEGMPEGGRMGGMSFGEPSNQLNVTVTQTGEILTENGDVYATSETGVTTDYTENENLLVENFQQLTYSCNDGTELMYNLFLPESYKESTSYPLVLFMPDATGEGSDAYKTLTESLGGVIWSEQEWQENHPCIVLAPQYEEANSSDPSYTMELLNEVENGYSVDTERIYLVGQSSGTIRSIKLFIDYPETFAGGILVAGQADEAYTDKLEELADENIWLICSAGDERAYPGMQAIVDAVNGQGTEVSIAQWSADLEDGQQEELSQEQLSEGNTINWSIYDAGTVMEDDVSVSAATEHMNTWRVAYHLDTVREWLFAQTK